MLSIIIPLVPPAARSAEIREGPTLTQVTVLSVVVPPRVGFQGGALVPDIPGAPLTASRLPLLSSTRWGRGRRMSYGCPQRRRCPEPSLTYPHHAAIGRGGAGHQRPDGSSLIRKCPQR